MPMTSIYYAKLNGTGISTIRHACTMFKTFSFATNCMAMLNKEMPQFAELKKMESLDHYEPVEVQDEPVTLRSNSTASQAHLVPSENESTGCQTRLPPGVAAALVIMPFVIAALIGAVIYLGVVHAQLRNKMAIL